LHFQHCIGIPFFGELDSAYHYCYHYQRFSVGARRYDWIILRLSQRPKEVARDGSQSTNHFSFSHKFELAGQGDCHLHMHTSVYQTFNLDLDFRLGNPGFYSQLLLLSLVFMDKLSGAIKGYSIGMLVVA
jgi:hypothetical protein